MRLGTCRRLPFLLRIDNKLKIRRLINQLLDNLQRLVSVRQDFFFFIFFSVLFRETVCWLYFGRSGFWILAAAAAVENLRSSRGVKIHQRKTSSVHNARDAASLLLFISTMACKAELHEQSMYATLIHHLKPSQGRCF